jgi:hypothetical protein
MSTDLAIHQRCDPHFVLPNGFADLLKCHTYHGIFHIYIPQENEHSNLPFLALASKRVWKGLASCYAVCFNAGEDVRVPPTSGFADMLNWGLLWDRRKKGNLPVHYYKSLSV